MIKSERINFRATKYAPNPKEVSYWIDLSSDSTGNIIKSYDPNTKNWIPVNDNTNDEQSDDILSLQNRCTALENNKANKATTLSGYGITDAYTKSQTNSYVDNKVAALVDSAPETLNTLNELSAALGDDPNFATTVTNMIGTKVSSSDITNIKVVSELPTTQETGVLYIKVN